LAKKKLKSKASPVDVWNTDGSPGAMLHAAHGLLSPRQLRLFAIACCKMLWGHRRASTGYSELLQLAEQIADHGDASAFEKQIAPYRRVAYPHGVIHLLAEDAGHAANMWVSMVDLNSKEQERHADVLREIGGNPFAAITLDSALLAWRDRTIPKLAQTCYDSNDFSMIGILGDALEEAGCIEQSILEHVRSEQPHFRGCWVVDLILGKK
jgi:hypothetical protein